MLKKWQIQLFNFYRIITVGQNVSSLHIALSDNIYYPTERYMTTEHIWVNCGIIGFYFCCSGGGANKSL